MIMTVAPFSKLKCKSHVHHCELLIYCLSEGIPERFQYETVTCSVCGLARLLAMWTSTSALTRKMTINILPPCLQRTPGKTFSKMGGFAQRSYVCPTCEKSGVPI